MAEITLESLAQRLKIVESKIAAMQPQSIPPTRNWKSVIGISERTEFSDSLEQEMARLRADDRAQVEREIDS